MKSNNIHPTRPVSSGSSSRVITALETKAQTLPLTTTRRKAYGLLSFLLLAATVGAGLGTYYANQYENDRLSHMTENERIAANSADGTPHLFSAISGVATVGFLVCAICAIYAAYDSRRTNASLPDRILPRTLRISAAEIKDIAVRDPAVVATAPPQFNVGESKLAERIPVVQDAEFGITVIHSTPVARM